MDFLKCSMLLCNTIMTVQKLEQSNLEEKELIYGKKYSQYNLTCASPTTSQVVFLFLLFINKIISFIVHYIYTYHLYWINIFKCSFYRFCSSLHFLGFLICSDSLFGIGQDIVVSFSSQKCV